MIKINYIKNSYFDWFGILNNYSFNTREILSNCEYGKEKTRDNYNFSFVRQIYTTVVHKKSRGYIYLSKLNY